MKVAYISSIGFADCDFPLIMGMQKKSVDVTYYILCECWALKGTLFNIKKQYPKAGIFPYTIYEDMFEPYKNSIDFTKVRIVNRTKASAFHPSTILLQFKLLNELLKGKYDVIHITFPLDKTECLLYFLRKKMVLTLHDPIPHSSDLKSRSLKRCRNLAFKNIPKILLLNKTMLTKFCEVTKYPKNQVFASKLGTYDCISIVDSVMPYSIDSPYILFFGVVASHKGIEYLIMAFNKICKCFPNVKLVIAGGGKIYFNKELFEKNENIIIINRYIEVSELAGLLKGCLFSVCPYKDATQSGVVQTAFTMGVPLIVTNVGALPECVENKKTGLVVQPCNVDELADAMSYLLNNPHEIARMKNNIISKWKPQMDWSSIVDDYLKCYISKV